MRNKLPCLLLAGALMLGLAACAPGRENPSPAPPLTTPPPEASIPVLSVPSAERPAPPLPADCDLPGRDYRPWQRGYMDFLSGLAWADLESRGLTTEAGEYYWPAYEGLAADRREVFCMDAGEPLRMTLVMALGSESYSLYDVDRDGVPELFVKYGSFEAAFTYQCYAFRDGQVVCIGEFDGGHSSLYAHPDKHAVLRAEGHMGFHEVYEYPMEGGVLTEEREVFREEDVRTYTPMEEIAPGAEYIGYFYTWLGTRDRSCFTGEAPYSEGRALLLPIADWQDGPAATGSNSEQARTAILAALDGKTEVYGASGDHSYGDTGPIAWSDYAQAVEGGHNSQVTARIAAHTWVDMNGDGQEECLLRVETEGRRNGEPVWTGGECHVVFSVQDGTVYAYNFHHHYDAVFYDDGAILDSYGGTVRLSFWKGQCYEYAAADSSAPPVKWVDGPPAG